MVVHSSTAGIERKSGATNFFPASNKRAEHSGLKTATSNQHLSNVCSYIVPGRQLFMSPTTPCILGVFQMGRMEGSLKKELTGGRQTDDYQTDRSQTHGQGLQLICCAKIFFLAAKVYKAHTGLEICFVIWPI